MYTTTCSACGKTFERLYEKRARDICYGCALKELCGNLPPEEGDFNSARIISGEMTEQEEKWLQEDLEAVESGRSIREPYEDEHEREDEDLYFDYITRRYGDS